jgi:Na+/H+ antiporter NhaD/arsenite permease-like protein
VTRTTSLLLLAALLLLPAQAALASGGEAAFDGGALSIIWVLPFAGMLLSIAIMPLALPEFWHHHFGKVAIFWALCVMGPMAVMYGFGVALNEFLHTILLDYVPFLILLTTLFTVAGGVRLTGTLVGTPVVNTLLLVVGTALAGWMGTTGAAMLMIRPLLRANAHRKYRVHSVVFFIFLVANIGGSLTPLGDPPLFLGFLKGVSFFWTTTHIFHETLFMSCTLLALFFMIDTVLFAREGKPIPPYAKAQPCKLGIEGGVNLVLLLGVVAVVLVSGMWNPGVGFSVGHAHLELQGIARDVLLIVLTFLSLWLTPKATREGNDFNWEPMLEVGKLFFGIFVSMIPAILILKAGEAGALKSVISLVTHDGKPVNAMYFWLSGGLSSFLDNAPTYLVFFNTAGGDAQHLMNDMAGTLAAISCGSVFMGANSYIGNAPNFMVRSIAESQGVKMPSFFGYMIWSCGILVPMFVLVTLIFF